MRPLRRLFIAGRWIAEILKCEAFLLGKLLENRDGLLAEWTVDMDQGDLFALEIASLLVADIFHDCRGLRPISWRHRKYSWEDRAVDGIGAPVPGGDHVHTVRERARNNGAGNGRRQKIDQHGAVFLEALVGLDAALGLVARVDRLELDGRPVYAAPERKSDARARTCTKRNMTPPVIFLFMIESVTLLRHGTQVFLDVPQQPKWNMRAQSPVT